MKKYKRLVMGLCLAYGSCAWAEDLLTVYEQAVSADPELKSSGLKVAIGAAQKGQALGQLLPQVTGSANWSENSYTQDAQGSRTLDYKGVRYFVSLSQSLIDFGKFWEWKRAQSTEEQYSSEHTEAQHALMFNVVDRYFGVLEAEDRLYFIQTEKNATEKQLQQVEKQFAKQLVKITDLYEVQARVDQIRADEIEAESKLVTAQEALKELTNAQPQGLFVLKDAIEYKELDGKLEDWLAVAKSENPSLAAQLKAVEAASDDVAAQKSKYLPVVDLQLSYYDTNTGYQSQRLSSQTQTEVAAINVNVPIFSGGTTTHRVFEAQSRLELSKENNESKIRALVKETSDAFLSSNANVRRIKAAGKALESAAKSREAMESGFKYGVETIGDVLQAQQAEFRAKRDLSQSKYDYMRNRIRFMRAIGTISVENLQEINGWLQKRNAG